jgi:hypothetical protein
LLLPWLAWAIYGKIAGREKRWNKRELRQLNANVEKLRSKNTTLTEADCCRELTSYPDYVGSRQARFCVDYSKQRNWIRSKIFKQAEGVACGVNDVRLFSRLFPLFLSVDTRISRSLRRAPHW